MYFALLKTRSSSGLKSWLFFFFFFNSSYKLTGKSSFTSTVFFLGEKRGLEDQGKNFFFFFFYSTDIIHFKNEYLCFLQVTLHTVGSMTVVI